MGESLERKHNKYDLEGIFKSAFDVQNEAKDSHMVDNIINRLCNVDDYMKSIFCVGMAIEMLKEDGLRVIFQDKPSKDAIKVDESVEAYFSKKQNNIFVLTNEDEDNTYIALLEQFLYKWLSIIDISHNEREVLSDILDSVKENTKLFYEELTQNEIKMLEWIDQKVVDLVYNVKNDTDVYKTTSWFIDKNVSNLISVYLMWGRSLERLEIVSHILNPLLEYVENNIFTKFESYILNESSKQYLNQIDTPNYFKIKLNVIKSLEKEDISIDRKFELLKEVRMLEIPKQTDKSLEKVKYLFENYRANSNDLDKLYDAFLKQRNIYKFSIQQREDELKSIQHKKTELGKDEKDNVEIIAQLVNLEEVIKEEKRDLEKSLLVIDEELNISKKAGVYMDEDKYELQDKETDQNLKEYAKELLNIKLSNNRWNNLSHQVLKEKKDEGNEPTGINFEYEKFLEELKKRDFDLGDDFFYKTIDKTLKKELKIYEPDMPKTNKTKSKEKTIGNTRER